MDTEYKHIDKNGKEIPLNKLTTEHLKNIIKYIEKKSKDGLTVIETASGFHDVDDFWGDEKTIYGDKVKEFMNYDEYIKELIKRQSKDMTKTLILEIRNIIGNEVDFNKTKSDVNVAIYLADTIIDILNFDLGHDSTARGLCDEWINIKNELNKLK